MASISACDNRRELREIAKELHEMNRRLDRLCRASIFSVGDPKISIQIEESRPTLYANDVDISEMIFGKGAQDGSNSEVRGREETSED